MLRSKTLIRISLYLIAVIMVSSCVTMKKSRYFNDLSEMQPSESVRDQKLIAPFDNLYISVLSIDENARNLFDINANMVGQNIIGYLVDKDGNIDFPYIGKINLEGLTITEATTKIQKSLEDYITRASVVIRFLDNKVTLLGQVESQGTYLFTTDNITVYEALSLGGGISQYGNRKKVVLIRDEDGKSVQHQLNLLDSKIINSEYYYIEPNDIIVVEPLRAVVLANNNFSIPSLIGTIATITALYVLFFPLNNNN